MSGTLPRPPDEATVTAYLSNQLPEPQAEAFEMYCLDHPEFARMVELDLTMKRGLREIGMRDLKPRAALRYRPPWAIAAALAAVIGCGLLLMWSPWRAELVAYRSPSEVPLQLRAGVHVDMTFLRLRGSDTAHRLVVPRRVGVLQLKIYPDTAPGRDGYSADLALDSIVGTRSVILDRLRTDADGFLDLYLPLSAVVGHTLNVTLTADADSSAAPAPAFRLQVVAATD
ncbi:MAG TPA: hypothetical protein VK727_04375 [Steroidobacteraceae bacterium]|nr:hypothetical protein [Steroidobacteraceae bacterium]